MENNDKNRRYQGRVAFVGIVAAVLYALLYGGVMRWLLNGTSEQDSLLTPLTVAAVGLLSLAAGGVVCLVLRRNPAARSAYWVAAGKITLLAAPVGFIQSLTAGLGYLIYSDFFQSFAILTALYLCFVFAGRGISAAENPARWTTRRILGRTAALFGILLVSVAVLVVRYPLQYGHLLRDEAWTVRMTYLFLQPLLQALPTLVLVPLGYLLFSLAVKGDATRPHRLSGRGTARLLVTALCGQVVAHGANILFYAGRLTDPIGGNGSLYAIDVYLSDFGRILSVGALLFLTFSISKSKLALWGARIVWASCAVRELVSLWENLALRMLQYKNLVRMEDYVRISKVFAYVNFALSMVTVVALCLLAVGLTRRYAVSRSFWGVPALSLTIPVATLVVSWVWNRVSGGSLESQYLLQFVSYGILSSLLGLAEYALGLAVLLRAPAAEAPSGQGSAPAETAAEPREEDYLMSL